ncbi:sugar ABC transporter substrate-binding protein [Paenibacillus filicis]|uniref:Sugar ABC transporter substrate-binding protein n=1 Tax=Paenibacillus gyeongsangnamensis TaxID=3388067 RepID=A0ABT4Q4E9_9BACL|nr:sugar ABC transporter substrate-binding protein [Paenibacillus filicis]MCZ8511727.1 sugar ABC transporter substrate-binding protein [Paenibacillus filicis]
MGKRNWFLCSSLITVFMLAGCNGGAQPAPTGQNAASNTQTTKKEETKTTASDKPFKGHEVSVYTSLKTRDAKTWGELEKAVEEKTGIKVKGIEAPQNYPDLVSKVTVSLSSGGSNYDIIYLDELLTTTFKSAGFLEPISDVMEPVKQNFSESVLKSISMSDGKYYTVPITTEGMYLFVNKKLFADAGLKYPTNKEEFLDAARKLTKDGVYGYGGSWSKGGQLFNDAIRWTYAFGGDYLNWDDPNTKAAFQQMHDFLYKDKVTAAAALGDTYDQMNQKMIDGKYGMVYQWAYLSGVMKDKFGKDFEVIPVPKFNTNQTLVAGWHMTLNKNSKQKDAAKEVLKFMASRDGQKIFVKFPQQTAGDQTVIKDPKVIEEVPFIKYIGQYSEAGSFKTRPMDKNINKLQDATESALQSYLSDQITLEECMARGQKAIKEILGK